MSTDNTHDTPPTVTSSQAELHRVGVPYVQPLVLSNSEPQIFNTGREMNGFPKDTEKKVSAWGREKVPEDNRLEDFTSIKEEKDTDSTGAEKPYTCQHCSMFICDRKL